MQCIYLARPVFFVQIIAVDDMSLILGKWDKTGFSLEKNKTLYSDKLNYIYESYIY